MVAWATRITLAGDNVANEFDPDAGTVGLKMAALDNAGGWSAKVATALPLTRMVKVDQLDKVRTTTGADPAVVPDPLTCQRHHQPHNARRRR